MTRTLVLGLLVGFASSAVAEQTPCFRELGAFHEAALLNASPSELSAQARCLILEFSTFPKAQFIPPAGQLQSTGPYHITVIGGGDGHRVTVPSFGPPSNRPTLIELFEKSAFGLGSPGTVLRAAP